MGVVEDCKASFSAAASSVPVGLGASHCMCLQAAPTAQLPER